MSLAMARPYKHPKTGVYWFRRTVPADLRAAVGKRELKTTLGTKDPVTAKAAAGPVSARYEAIIARAREGQTEITGRDVHALCGVWYREEVARRGDDPNGKQADDEITWALSGYKEHGDPLAPAGAREKATAKALLERHGFVAAPASIHRVANALMEASWLIERYTLRRAMGDWSPDANLDRFPALNCLQSRQSLSAVSFGSLVAGWAAERSTTGKALYDRERTAKALETFLGHDDATRVTADDVVRWKEARLAAGRSVKTVSNDIGELQPIWKWAKTNRKLSFAENPFAGLSPRIKKTGQRARVAFTDEEARRILEAARGETGALRWLPWVACFTGSRIAEACQSRREDIRQAEPGGPWLLHIHSDGPDRTLKTPQSERMVPLHPALIAEGFLEYVATLPADSALFPDIRPDKFGSRGGTATKNHGRWVRQTVKVTDTRKDPAHAWRHLFRERAQRANVPQHVTEALMGHLNTANESEGYGRGLRFMPEVTAPHVASMSSPL